MRKVYVLTAFNRAFEANRYFWSVDAQLKDTVIPIAIIYKDDNGKYGDCFLPKNAIVVKMNKQYPGNAGRHKDLRSIIPTLNLDKNSWVLFTDTHDVIFQKKLPEFSEDIDIFVAPEGKKIGEIEYWKQFLIDDLWSWDCYNCGTFVMKYEVLLEYWDFMYEKWIKFRDWYKNTNEARVSEIPCFPFRLPVIQEMIKEKIAVIFNQFHDTLAYNAFLRQTKRKYKELPGLFACYAFQYELGLIKQKRGRTCTADDKLISVVHFNGCTKKYAPWRKK